MAHKVTFEVPKRLLGNEDITFIVESDGERFGTLAISKGGVRWRPARGKLVYDIRWDRFDSVIASSGLTPHNPRR